MLNRNEQLNRHKQDAQTSHHHQLRSLRAADGIGSMKASEYYKENETGSRLHNSVSSSSSIPLSSSELPFDRVHQLRNKSTASIRLSSALITPFSPSQRQLSPHYQSSQQNQSQSQYSQIRQITPPHTPRHSADHHQKQDKKPTLYKTELCRSFEETNSCRYGDKCQFAHSVAEIRGIDRHPKYKSELCKTFWEKGSCPYGKRCCFVHTEKDVSDQQQQQQQQQQQRRPSTEHDDQIRMAVSTSSSSAHSQQPSWSGISPARSSFEPITPANEFIGDLSLDAHFKALSMNDSSKISTLTRSQYAGFHQERPQSQNSMFESRLFDQHQRSYSTFTMDAAFMVGTGRRSRTFSSPCGPFSVHPFFSDKEIN